MDKRTEVEDLISSHGIGTELLRAFLHGVLDAGGTLDDARRIETDEGLRLDIGRLVAKSFPVWRTIRTGTYGSLKALLFDLAAAGYFVTGYAKAMVSRDAFVLTSEERKYDLVIVTPADLGFKGGGIYSKIVEVAAEYGLEQPLVDLALYLRLFYPSQPKGEILRVAHKPIRLSDDYSRLLSVSYPDGAHSNGDRWLDATLCDATRVWSSDDRFVFVRSS